jgi:flagellar protein FlbD
MIRLTRLNRVPMVLNADLIEHIDVTPDTVITLTTGQILRVREDVDEVIQRIVEFRRRISRPGGDPAPLGRQSEVPGTELRVAQTEEVDETTWQKPQSR